MKKILFCLLTLLLCGAMQAQNVRRTPQPEGKLVPYTLKAYDYYTGGFSEFSIDLVFSEDGTKVWFSTLVPTVVQGAWHEGKIEGDKVIIDHTAVFMDYDYYGDGTIAHLMLGEIDSDYNVYDIVMVKDGDRIYVDDDASSPSRTLVIYSLGYYAEAPDFPCLWSISYCFDMSPAAVQEEVQTIPAEAEQTPYIYYMRDSENYPLTVRGIVATLGDQCYFDQFTSLTSPLVGNLKDGKVTLAKGQYIGRDGGFELHAAGCKADSTLVDFELNCDALTKVYTPADIKVGVGIYNPDGQLLDTRSVLRLEPYAGDVEATPSDPYEVSFGYYSEYEQYLFAFSLANLDVNGKYMNPDCLGYEVYLDEDLYEFSPDVFKIDEPMTLIPYGMRDNQQVSHEINWTGHGGRIWLTEDLFNIIGVRAVYMVDGVTHTSNIISVDQNGGQYTNFKKDETAIVAPRQDCPSVIYDLQGRRVLNPSHGLYIKDGKKVLM